MKVSVADAARAVTAKVAFERLARAGYVARGVIYILMGILAFKLAWGVSGDSPGQEGAMHLIARQRFGRVLLVVLAIGLAGYTMLRVTQAFAGRTPEAGRHSTKDRVGAFGSGCAYGLFCAAAIGILAGSTGGGGTKPRAATSDVFGWPGGRVLVAVAGLVFIGVAAYQAYTGTSRTFLKDSKSMYMTPRTLRRFTVVGVVGHLARAVTFGLVGIFLAKSAIEYDAREAVGIDGALQRLQTHGYGTIAVTIVACGLIAFGLYSIADARFRKI